MLFLTQWLTKHILGHDKNYGQSMVGRESEIAEANRPFLEYHSVAESGEASDAI